MKQSVYNLIHVGYFEDLKDFNHSAKGEVYAFTYDDEVELKVKQIGETANVKVKIIRDCNIIHEWEEEMKELLV